MHGHLTSPKGRSQLQRHPGLTQHGASQGSPQRASPAALSSSSTHGGMEVPPQHSVSQTLVRSGASAKRQALHLSPQARLYVSPPAAPSRRQRASNAAAAAPFQPSAPTPSKSAVLPRLTRRAFPPRTQMPSRSPSAGGAATPTQSTALFARAARRPAPQPGPLQRYSAQRPCASAASIPKRCPRPEPGRADARVTPRGCGARRPRAGSRPRPRRPAAPATGCGCARARSPAPARALAVSAGSRVGSTAHRSTVRPGSKHSQAP